MNHQHCSIFGKRFPSFLLAASILCTVATSVFAAENPAILAVNRSASASYLHSTMHYIEPDDGELNTGYFDYEEGTIKGYQVAVSYMGTSGFYLNAAWSKADGMLDYHSFFDSQVNNPIQVPSITATHEFDLKIGKGIALQNASWMLTPYLSAGRRRWERDIDFAVGSELDETFDFNYFGLGQLVQYSAWSQWVISGDAMIGKTAHATINVPADGLNHTALGTAPIVKLSLEVDYQTVAKLHLFAGYQYTYYTFGQSEVQPSGFLQPYGETKLETFTVGVRFSY